ncbi:hypothetical protein V1460_25700 [Streptomyces sp. SCSIO 30461]|uniref:hypothetical protein n=1 Tax=Streptomyces sp. SCSIO 30461 TaxID=3118085 RepID=UPI0030CEFD23
MSQQNQPKVQKAAFVGELAFAGILGILAISLIVKSDWLAVVPAIGCLSFLVDARRRKRSWN